ncbi:MAG TPA: hypothetical protein PK559_02600 [Ignavibacteriaceae bacterium]|nr:hypothetical protein [Ignavibacteriaceae bacterium]
MKSLKKQRAIDLLINHFWQNGYITVKRRFGTYLSEPPKIGDYEIDVLAKQRKNFAIGITILSEDVKNPGLLNKIAFLAARESRFTKKRIPLFVGVSLDHVSLIKGLVNSLDDSLKTMIKIIPLFEQVKSDLFDSPSIDTNFTRSVA